MLNRGYHHFRKHPNWGKCLFFANRINSRRVKLYYHVASSMQKIFIMIDAAKSTCILIHTIDLSEIRRSPVDMYWISHLLSEILHPRWVKSPDFWTINSNFPISRLVKLLSEPRKMRMVWLKFPSQFGRASASFVATIWQIKLGGGFSHFFQNFYPWNCLEKKDSQFDLRVYMWRIIPGLGSVG